MFEEIKEQLKSEFTLKTAVMTEAFQRGITVTEQEQEIQYAPEVQKLYNEANCAALGITVPDDYAPLG